MARRTRWTPRLSVLVGAGLVLHTAGCGGGANDGARASETRTAGGSVAQDVDWKRVDQAMGRSGQMQDGGVYKYSMPRSDLRVTAGGVRILPALALGSWLAMKPHGGDSVVAMGDLVLTEAEYNRVIARLQEGGVGQTAVHKHLPEESPAVWWTHVHAHGDAVAIAQTVRAALALTGTPAQQQGAQSAPQDIGLDTARISRVLGHAGKVNGGVYQVSIPRSRRSGRAASRSLRRWAPRRRSTSRRLAAGARRSTATS